VVLVCSWRTDRWLLLVSSLLYCCRCVFNVCGWELWLGFFVFVVVYYDIEDRVVYVCVYVVKL
jgi:hypothetical protein